MISAPSTELRVALAGNPNAGKSTLFNALTGGNQHVANWPGKTVERKAGHFRFNGTQVEVIDLPGAYSLRPHSDDEVVASESLIDDPVDVVVAVVDASRLERHLYLVVQLLEMGTRLVVALNMSDAAAGQGVTVDVERLAERLAAPVVPTVATQNVGLEDLRRAIVARAADPPTSRRLDYGPEIEARLNRLEGAFAADPWPRARSLRRLGAADESGVGPAASPVALAMADVRYQWIHEIVTASVRRVPSRRVALGRRTDRWLIQPRVGIPVFLAAMYLVFQLVVNVSAPFVKWIATTIDGPVAGTIEALLEGLGAPAWLSSLILDGVLAGIGGVLAFIPGLILLFIFLGVLEDSGYMARAAVVMDRWMGRAGLHGKSFVPLMLGFGCGVPAIYATRSLEARRDRIVTALLVPFMSCSARLPVYLLFAMALFPRHAGGVVWALYAVGIAAAMLTGWLLSRSLFRGTTRLPLVLELPPFRLPHPATLARTVSTRTGSFVRQAGTLIVGLSMVVWLLTNLPWGATDLRESWFGRLSTAAAPVFAPAGFGTWEATGALVTGFVAKEMVIATLAQVYDEDEAATPPVAGEGWDDVVPGLADAATNAGRTLLASITPGLRLVPLEEDPGPPSVLVAALQARFDRAAALAFLVFILLYVPCVATLGAIRHEFGGRWAAFAAVYQTAFAWIAAAIIFQAGRWLILS